MSINNIFTVPGTEYPAGRLTRVIAGPGAPVEPDGFVMGHVTIYPGGEVPEHVHGQEEVYIIVAGSGVIELDGAGQPITAGDYVYMRPHIRHCLRNTSAENMIMIFCYAPKGIVEHWQHELSGGGAE